MEIGKCDSCCFVIEEFMEPNMLQSGPPSFARNDGSMGVDGREVVFVSCFHFFDEAR